MLWGRNQYEGSGWSLDQGGPGVKLGEHEFKDFKVTYIPGKPHHFSAVGWDDEGNEIEFERLWIEDSVGTRHEVPEARKLLNALRDDYKTWCKVTGYWESSPARPARNEQPVVSSESKP